MASGNKKIKSEKKQKKFNIFNVFSIIFVVVFTWFSYETYKFYTKHKTIASQDEKVIPFNTFFFILFLFSMIKILKKETIEKLTLIHNIK